MRNILVLYLKNTIEIVEKLIWSDLPIIFTEIFVNSVFWLL